MFWLSKKCKQAGYEFITKPNKVNVSPVWIRTSSQEANSDGTKAAGKTPGTYQLLSSCSGLTGLNG